MRCDGDPKSPASLRQQARASVNMENTIERLQLERFIALHLMQPVPNDLTTKCPFTVVAGGATEDKAARYVQGSEYKEADGSRSIRSGHVGMEIRKRSSRRGDRYIGSGF